MSTFNGEFDFPTLDGIENACFIYCTGNSTVVSDYYGLVNNERKPIEVIVRYRIDGCVRQYNLKYQEALRFYKMNQL